MKEKESSIINKGIFLSKHGGVAMWIDLTHPIEEDMSTWTGRCGFHQEVKMTYAQGCLVKQYKMHGGIGTHMDAPLHFFEGATSIGEVEVDHCIIPLFVLDISKTAHKDTLITEQEVQDFEKNHQANLKGGLFVAYTGWYRKWKTDEYRGVDAKGKMHFPGFSKEAASYLVEKGIVGLGIDTLSPDGSNDGYPVHEVVLGSNRYIIENIAYLDQVPATGSSAIVLPIKIMQGPEAAIRMVAKVN